MAKLVALTPINHDGKLYEIGEDLQVSDKAQIAQLVSVGAAATPADYNALQAKAAEEQAALAAQGGGDAAAGGDAAGGGQGGDALV